MLPQTDLEGGKLAFDIIGGIYTALFTIELLLRLWAFGCRDFFCSADWAWSFLDLFIVVTSLWELSSIILEPFTADSESGNLNGITSLKAFRIIRFLPDVCVCVFFFFCEYLWVHMKVHQVLAMDLEYIVLTHCLDIRDIRQGSLEGKLPSYGQIPVVIHRSREARKK